jgi:mannosyltransferase
VPSRRSSGRGYLGSPFFDISAGAPLSGAPRCSIGGSAIVKGRTRYWALVGLALFAFALRVYGLASQSLWRDEVDAVRFASQPLKGVLGMFLRPGENGPLYYLVLRPWLDVAGRSEFSLRFFSVVFGVLSVLLLYRVARRLFPRLPLVPLLAGLFAATSPYLIWYSKEGKMYSLVVFASLLSMDRLLAAAQKGGWLRWLSYALVTGAAFYVHLVSVLIVPAQVVVVLLLRGGRKGLTWRAALSSLLIMTAIYLPMLAWQLPLLVQPSYVGYDFVALPQMLASLLTNYTLGVLQQPNWRTLTPAIGLLVAAVFLGIRESRPSSVVFLASWMIVPVVLFYLVTLSRPIYTPRYLIFQLPAFLLLLALGAVAIWRRTRMMGMVLIGALLVMNGIGLWVQERTPLKADFRAATRFVVERLDAGDLVLFQIPHGRYSFEYYMGRSGEATPAEGAPQEPSQSIGDQRAYLPFVATGGRAAYRWAEGLYTNAGMSSEEVSLRMTDAVADSRVVWLIESEAGMWDQDGLVKAWLQDHAVLTESGEFVSVAAYRYELP